MMLQLVLATVLTASFAADDNATNIIGSWTLTAESEGAKRDLTMEFTKDGKNKQVLVVGKDKFAIEGTYKLEKDKLTMTVKAEGVEETATCTIKELTKTKMVLFEHKTQREMVFKKKETLN